jgi:hypothetical protein
MDHLITHALFVAIMAMSELPQMMADWPSWQFFADLSDMFEVDNPVFIINNSGNNDSQLAPMSNHASAWMYYSDLPNDIDILKKYLQWLHKLNQLGVIFFLGTDHTRDNIYRC